MNHVTQQLQGYYDGELDHRTATAVEAHLALCTTCQAELASLEGLSELLATWDPARLPTTPGQFAAQVALQLPRRDHRSAAREALTWGWRLAPVLVLAVWVFVRTATVTTAVALGLTSAGIGGDVLAGLVGPAILGRESAAWLPSILESLGLTALATLSGDLGDFLWLLQLPIASYVFTALVALAIASWLATWLMRGRGEEGVARAAGRS